jgi:hypothetical protein
VFYEDNPNLIGGKESIATLKKQGPTGKEIRFKTGV